MIGAQELKGSTPLSFVRPMPRIRAENVKKHKERNRADILAAAEKIFSNEGFLESNLTDIADVAGVGRSTLYEYFDSKDDILVGVAAFRLAPLMVELDNLETDGGPMDEVCVICRATIDFMAANLDLTKIVTWESHYLSKAHQDRLWNIVSPFIDKLRELIGAGLPDEDADILARVVAFALRDAGDILLDAEASGLAVEDVKRTTIRFIRRGLGLPDLPA